MVACIDCDVVFSPPNHTGTLPQRCDVCRIARTKILDAAKTQRWREAHPEENKESARRTFAKWNSDPKNKNVRRDRAARRTYGLEPGDIDRMLTEQDHLCAICRNGHIGVGGRLHIDHDHVTGKIRALLCSNCNTMLGLAGDSAERLDAAAAYLRCHSAS